MARPRGRWFETQQHVREHRPEGERAGRGGQVRPDVARVAVRADGACDENRHVAQADDPLPPHEEAAGATAPISGAQRSPPASRARWGTWCV